MRPVCEAGYWIEHSPDLCTYIISPNFLYTLMRLDFVRVILRTMAFSNPLLRHLISWYIIRDRNNRRPWYIAGLSMYFFMKSL